MGVGQPKNQFWSKYVSLKSNFSFVAPTEAEIAIWPPEGGSNDPPGGIEDPPRGQGGEVNLKKNLKWYVQILCWISAS